MALGDSCVGAVEGRVGGLGWAQGDGAVCGGVLLDRACFGVMESLLLIVPRGSLG